MDNNSKDLLFNGSPTNNSVRDFENVECELVGDCIVITLWDSTGTLVGVSTHDLCLPSNA